jgi:predicted transcriptional regulator
MYDEVEEETVGGLKGKGKMAHMKREEKRDKLRSLKRLAHIDAYDKEDTLTVSEADTAVEDMLLFMTDTMVKKVLTAAEFKTVNNSLVSILDVLGDVAVRERKKFKKV